MDARTKKKWYIIGAAAAAILLVVILCLILGGGKYDKYYSKAEKAFLQQDYGTAISLLEKAIAERPEAEAYLLLARCYEARGDTDRAIDILYLGYTKTGDKQISRFLEQLKGDGSSDEEKETIKIGGTSVTLDATSLTLANAGLTDADLGELTRLRSLESLSLSGNRLHNISVLAELTNLTFLHLADNDISDLMPLRSLTRLKTLYIDGNPITDFTALYTLTSLRTLSMKNIEVTFDQLTELQEALPECRIYADEAVEEVEEITIAFVKFRTDATSVDLSGHLVSDLSPLSKCTALQELAAAGCGINDISPLVDLRGLTRLDLSDNSISDLRSLLTMSGLKYLNVHDNLIRDITVLGYLTALEELDLGGNELGSLTPLGKLTGLKKLSLSDTDLSNEKLDSLTGRKNLTELDLRENDYLTPGAVEQLRRSLPGCNVLADEDLPRAVKLGGKSFTSDAEEITVVSAGVSDLSGLEKFRELKSLTLTENAVSSLEPLRGLPKLENLALGNNRVSDLSPLSSCTTLKRLLLPNNKVSDLKPLYGLTNLHALDIRGNPSLKLEDVLALREALPDCEIASDFDLSQGPGDSGGNPDA